jgi:hypothetical protein
LAERLRTNAEMVDRGFDWVEQNAGIEYAEDECWNRISRGFDWLKGFRKKC